VRTPALLAALSTAAAAVALTATPAHAAPGHVDGTVTAAGVTCTWSNAVTSDTPPNTLTIDHTTVSPSCSASGITVTLGASPTVTFNDAAGTAFSPQVVVNVTAPIVGTCRYQVVNLTVYRVGTSRTYTGSNLTATELSPRRLLCPDSQTVDSVQFTFH